MLACTSIVAAQGPAVFRTGTDVVLVPVSVTDRNGRFVGGLAADHFQISDDGAWRAVKPFSAERVPVSLAILLDISGNLEQNPQERLADDARWAETRRAIELLLTRLGPDDEVLFAVFNEVAKASPWTKEHHKILGTFDLLYRGGGTALLESVKQIASVFHMARHQRKVLLLISDGNDMQIGAAGLFHQMRMGWVPSNSELPGRMTSAERGANSPFKGRGMPCAGPMPCCMPSASASAAARL